jgi:hypothetical protein
MPPESYLQEYLEQEALTGDTAKYYLRILRKYWSPDILHVYFSHNYEGISTTLDSLPNETAQKLVSAFLNLSTWLCETKGEVVTQESYAAFGVPFLSLEELDLVLSTPLSDFSALRGLTFWRFKLITYFLIFVEDTPQALLDLTIEHVRALSKHPLPHISGPFRELISYEGAPTAGYAFSGASGRGRLDKTSIHRIVSLASQRLFSRHLQPKAIAHAYYLLPANARTILT